MRGVLGSLGVQRVSLVSMAIVFAFVFAVLLVVQLFHSEHVGEVGSKLLVFSKENRPSLTRKLLQSAGK
ncbi:TPD1 protein homolog 1-like [Fagus crenata]